MGPSRCRRSTHRGHDTSRTLCCRPCSPGEGHRASRECVLLGAGSLLVSHWIHSHGDSAGYPELLDSCLLGIGGISSPTFVALSHWLTGTGAVLGPIWSGAVPQFQYHRYAFDGRCPRGARRSARESPRELLAPRVHFCVRRSYRRSVSAPNSPFEVALNPFLRSFRSVSGISRVYCRL